MQMKALLHFAKVFGFVWGAIIIVYLITFSRGMSFVVASYGTTRPSSWLMQMIFFFSVLPALFVAGLWEILRVVRLHMVR